ncbi:acetyl-CoA carboxylase biotin carboxyl carrier protein subunit [Xylophilus sp. GW821-FHT01B05]
MPDYELRSEVTGSVWKVLVQPGAKVAAEEPLVVVESMKMEIPLLAPAAGEVFSLLVEEGEQVEEDQLLVVLRCPG